MTAWAWWILALAIALIAWAMLGLLAYALLGYFG